MKFKFTLFLLILFSFISLSGQTSSFNVDEYKTFLESHKNLTPQALQQMHDAGMFEPSVEAISQPLYYDSVKIKLGLTDYEQSLIEKYGFVVSERLSQETFGSQIISIYCNDLPVFVSTDAILYSLHSSYDRILRDIEVGILIPTLKDLLEQLKAAMPALENKYNTSSMSSYLKDVDLYLSTAQSLLTGNVSPYYSENSSKIDEFIGYIDAEDAMSISFFSETPRDVDFSQFKPRGHYASSQYPELENYFRTMMWLGRMELYLIAPEADAEVAKEGVQRQTIMSFLIKDLFDESTGNSDYEMMEDFLLFQIGEQDNVTIDKIGLISEELGLESTADLLEETKFDEFQNLLTTKSYAFQRILSQILYSDPLDPEQIVPASAFLLFGQRFIIDSYITGNVVYDKVAARMLPKTLDILFALGNDAALQLLNDELEEYKYSSNLAALRYLVDSYEDDFWEETIYNGWLNSIRKLNPPENRTELPEFMQTNAWWQQKMNTQLAAWSELRHDFVLYAKQSYTGGVTCYYPYSYVEPFPEFFETLKMLAQDCYRFFSDMNFEETDLQNSITQYYERSISIYDTLGSIAQKELDGETFTPNETKFLAGMLAMEGGGCMVSYNGWYTKLFYEEFLTEEGLYKNDLIVVDYHTAPTDALGNPVGWVAHSGTGPVDMAVIIAENQYGEPTAFVGPVLSYYELTTTGFTRLNDDEWASEYLQTANRPDWTNIYLANNEGATKGSGPSLITSVEDDNSSGELPTSLLLAQNYPNPFNGQTLINFSIPGKLSNSKTTLKIYDITGREVKVLVDEILPSGNYIAKWNATNNNGATVSSGIYLYRLMVGDSFTSGKMCYLK